MTAALAQVVLAAAARALPALDGAEREHALNAIDDFVAAPTAAGCLRATRRLRALGRHARNEASWQRLTERSLGRGIERVRQLPALTAEAAATLAALPVDARAGRRLEALAILIEAHQQLAARLREVAASRRALIEAGLTAEPPPRERRRRR